MWATQHGKHVASQRLKARPPFLDDLLFENPTYLSASHSVQTLCSSTYWIEPQSFNCFSSSAQSGQHICHPTLLQSLFACPVWPLSFTHTDTQTLSPLACSLTPIHGLTTLPRFHGLWVQTAHTIHKGKLCFLKTQMMERDEESLQDCKIGLFWGLTIFVFSQLHFKFVCKAIKGYTCFIELQNCLQNFILH